MTELDEAEQFMREQLGVDWRDALLHARAVAPPDATNEHIDEAQQRAVELVSSVQEDWTLETREQTANAWWTIWANQRTP